MRRERKRLEQWAKDPKVEVLGPQSYDLVPLMALLDLGSSAFLGSRNREHLSKPELKRLVPFMFLGFVLGVTVLRGERT